MKLLAQNVYEKIEVILLQRRRRCTAAVALNSSAITRRLKLYPIYRSSQNVISHVPNVSKDMPLIPAKSLACVLVTFIDNFSRAAELDLSNSKIVDGVTNDMHGVGV